MADVLGPSSAAVPWTTGAGAYLAIGTSPAAIALGADLAHSSGGLSAPGLVLAVVAALALMVFLGVIGVRPPAGMGVTLAGASSLTLDRTGARAVQVVVVFGMVGWIGFGFALGGAAIGDMVGLPQPVASLMLGSVVVASAIGNRRTSNLVSLVAGAMTIALSVVIVAAGPDVSAWPRIYLAPSLSLVGPTVVSFLGYVSIFAVRSPDFTVSFGTRRDVVRVAFVLLGPLVGLVAVGAMLAYGQGTADVVSALGETTSGRLLIAIAIVAPAHASLVSGGLALSGLSALDTRRAFVVVGVVGIMAGMVRFDLVIGPWLRSLGVVALPIGAVLAAEVRRRRRGAVAQQMPARTWLPATVVGVVLLVPLPDLAPLVALALAIGGVVLRSTITVDRRVRRVH